MASSDWWASRKVVSVRSRRFCLRDPFGEAFGAELLEQLARARGRRRRDRAAGWAALRMRRGTRLAGHGGVAVDDDVGQVGEQPGGAVAARGEVEQRGRLFQQAGGDAAGLEIGVVDDVFEERNVGLDAAHAELAQAAVHALAGVAEFAAPGGDLDQQGIVIGRDDGAAVGRAAVEADAETGGGAVGGELAVIGDEVVGGVLGGDAALQGVAVERDAVLRGQVDFGAVEVEALRHLDLAADEVDAGDHFGDGVLHLDARVDLDEVPVAGIGVHQELDGAGVVVAGGAGQGDGGVGQSACGWRHRGRRRGRLRPPSDGGAARSNRARRGGGCCRGGRPGSGLRCGGRGG